MNTIKRSWAQLTAKLRLHWNPSIHANLRKFARQVGLLGLLFIALMPFGQAYAYSSPYIQNFNPASGPVGTSVTVTGSGFIDTTQVQVNNVNATYSIVNDNTLTLTVPANATSGQIAIINPANAAWSGSNFTVTADYAYPYIQNFTPSSGPVGTVVTVTGSGFTGATQVQIGNVNASYNVVDDGTLTLTVPNNAVSGQIAIINPAHAAWAGSSFTVTTSSPPTISSFSPTSGAVGTAVTITGSGFTGVTGVGFNGSSASYTVSSATTINVTVPTSATSGSISVSTDHGTATSASAFTVSGTGGGTAPTISSFSPTSGAVGTVVTISGTGFTGVTSVAFNGNSASQYTVNSDTSISATVPTSATSGIISVSTDHGTATSASSFTVGTGGSGAAPTITGIFPASGTVGTGVTITGTNLSNAIRATFGGVASENAGDSVFLDAAETQATVIVPSGISAGSLTVTITTAAGTATSPTNFMALTLPPVPVINSVTPTTASVGETVTVQGANFSNDVIVTFNGVPAAAPSNVTATSMDLVVPAAANNGLIGISTRGGTAYSPSSFTVSGSNNTAPTLGNFTVVNGQIKNADNQTIQIRGINLYGFNAHDTLIPEFLWAMDWKEQLNQVKALGFNAVRCPIVPDTLHSTVVVNGADAQDGRLTPQKAPNVDIGNSTQPKNTELVGKTPREVLDLWMNYADSIGLYVVLDMHSVSNLAQYDTWFDVNLGHYPGFIWNGQAYTKTDWINDLTYIATHYANLPHFLGIDVFNEPHGMVRWDAGDSQMSDEAYFWKPAVEQAADAILAANPNLLIFVQGVGPNFDPNESKLLESYPDINMNWGENLMAEGYNPLTIADNKLVLAPHTYGPDTSMKPTFSAPEFPNNLAAEWDILFGKFFPAHAVIPGEFGSHYGQNDGSLHVPNPKGVTWLKTFVNYLIEKNNLNGFLWDYVPNSGDTSGIIYGDPYLVNNFGVRTDKMDVMLHLWSGTPIN